MTSPSKGTNLANLRVLIAGGGTGGHIIPALAVAREPVAHHDAEVLNSRRGICRQLPPFGAQSSQHGMGRDDKQRSSDEVGRTVTRRLPPLPPLYIFKTLQVII
ncbi:MAG: glycosyltransferase [Terracidiphilus sp.]|jgi:hypothetical protein